MTSAFDPTALQAGDVMLYRPVGAFGALIKFHTGGPAAHVEVYAGNSRSFASRDKLGAAIYPWRNTELMYVLRPRTPFNGPKALAYFETQLNGQKYGWTDLLNFCGYSVNAPSILWSPCAPLRVPARGVPG